MLKLKHIAAMRAGGTPSVHDDTMWSDDGLPWVTISDISQAHLVTETGRRVSPAGIEAKRLPVGGPGTLLFAMYASVGALGELGTRASWNQAILGIEAKTGLADQRFLRYWLEHLRPSLSAALRSNTQDNLNAAQVGNLDFPSLPLCTQRQVADFLDAETGRIDALIAKKRRLVALLEERVECHIREKISRSALVDPDAVADTASVRKVLTKVSRSASEGGEMITAFRDGQVTARSLRRAVGYTESWTEGARLQGVQEGDVVVHGLDGFAGAIGTAEVAGVCSPVYHVCLPADGGDPVYLGRMLHILAKDGYLQLFASSTRERAVDFRNWDLFGRIPVPRVPLAEQREIGNSIRKIGPLKLAVERSAALARERRQALITAAVTGSMELPGLGR